MINQYYKQACETSSDINEHLPILKYYASKSDTIIEMGVRNVVSTWAFLMGNPQKMLSIDIYKSSNVDLVYKESKINNINYTFLQANTLNIDIEKTDLLFIDTYHHYEQLKIELNRHSHQVNKWIIMHDTTLFAHKSEYLDYLNFKPNYNKGIWDSIEDFLNEKKEWKIKEKFSNNNGLTILERI